MTCECKTLGYTCKECIFDPLLSAVEIGTKNNIIFYDTDATVGQISKRLFSLILSNFENYDHYNGDKIVSFILPYSAKYDIDLWESNIFVKKMIQYTHLIYLLNLIVD